MSNYFVKPENCSNHNLFPGVDITTMAGDQVMLSMVEMQPHAVVEEHSHPHEQIGVLLTGQLVFTVGDETQTLEPGEMWRIPGGIKHKVIAGADGAKAVDIFNPVREDYL